MGDSSIDCPECADTLTERGLYGHMKLKHGWTADQVRQWLDTGEAPADAPADAPAQAGSAAPAEAAASGAADRGAAEAPEAATADSAHDLLDADPDGDGDPLDEALAEWVHRRKQREAIRTLSEMDDRADRTTDDRDRGRSPVEDVVAELGADALRDALTADDDGMTEDDVRRAVRQEMDRTAAADGAGVAASDWRVAALEASDGDPDAVAELIEATESGGLTDAVARAADAATDLDADALGAAVELVAEGRKLWQATRPAPAPTPAPADAREAPPEYAEYAAARERADHDHDPAPTTGPVVDDRGAPPEVPTGGRQDGRADADAAGRDVRRSQERLDRVTGEDGGEADE